MKRFKIVHKTTYEYCGLVQLLPHAFRLRPREGHELRIESSKLNVNPSASLRWHRDVEGNSIAIASFLENKVKTLCIESEIVIQKYDINPHDFVLADYAVDYPFYYQADDKVSLYPYLKYENDMCNELLYWLDAIWKPDEKIQTFSLLNRLNAHIFRTIQYQQREEEGVQAAEDTVVSGLGSCRDLAYLFIVAAQQWGFAARFVSGYIYSGPASPTLSGSTHAWAEVFLPGAGWKGFDPTFGAIVGVGHIAMAVARLPEQVPPIAGKFYGPPGSSMTVDVWVTEFPWQPASLF